MYCSWLAWVRTNERSERVVCASRLNYEALAYVISIESCSFYYFLCDFLWNHENWITTLRCHNSETFSSARSSHSFDSVSWFVAKSSHRAAGLWNERERHFQIGSFSTPEILGKLNSSFNVSVDRISSQLPSKFTNISSCWLRLVCDW